jgi:hypothetical protein
MSWTHGLRAALAVCVLLLVAPAGCGTGEAHERRDGESPSPVGELLDKKDDAGRRYRQVAEDGAPAVRIEVTPDSAGGWDVRLTPRHFRFSPAGTRPVATAGRGLAHLFVDGDPVARLRTPAYHLAARLVPHGTHHITARLYADDGTVWAVHGKPVESTADVTASETESSPGTASGRSGTGAMSAKVVRLRTVGRGSRDPAGKAS